jgi:hypothetical protein
MLHYKCVGRGSIEMIRDNGLQSFSTTQPARRSFTGRSAISGPTASKALVVADPAGMSIDGVGQRLSWGYR